MENEHDLILTYYGDDFTGSTDVLEVLAMAGIRTLLFLEDPDPALLEAHPDVEAVGLAGMSRAMTPAEMDEELPDAFARLHELGAPIVHYKVCSTFDSSPEIGSIGRAIDVGHEVVGGSFVPVVVGAPRLGRYCAFGNLFARSGPESDVFRLDRHPTMSQHPVTPMQESDLRRHLSEQTDRSIALFNLLQYDRPEEEMKRRLDEVLAEEPEIVLFDALYEEHLPAVGSMVWAQAQQGPFFAAGSSGMEYALTAYWRESGVLSGPEPTWSLDPADQVVVVSGSCSPVTGRQIEHAVEQGFAEVTVETPRLLDDSTEASVRDRAIEQGIEAVERGESLVVHTCQGPEDERIAESKAVWRDRASSFDGPDREGGSQTETFQGGRRIGRNLGLILARLLRETDVRRVIVAGGDTSGYVSEELPIQAVEMAAPLTPGSPLCRVIESRDPTLDDLEITFKGGQTGRTEFFEQVRDGAF